MVDFWYGNTICYSSSLVARFEGIIMGRTLISQLLPTLQKLDWSGVPEATTAGALVFRTMLDQVDGYRGDPKDLGVALRTIRTTDSLPYMYAGIAYILLAAAGPRNDATGTGALQQGDYDEEGLQAALEWLEKAQETAPDHLEINIIEVLIYIYSGRYDDARLVLDYLQGQRPDNYYLLRAEMTYWQAVGEHETALTWSQRALEEAETVPQRLRLKSSVAAIHRAAGDTSAALQSYKEALHFDDNNAWLCHQISLLHYEQNEFEEAAHYNERALRTNPDLAEAQQLREQLSEQQPDSSRFLGRFFG